MFRFTIRELVLLTLVVAMGVGWCLREEQLQTKLREAIAWRRRAGALEAMMKNNGWKITWDFDSEEVIGEYPGTTAAYSTNHFEPIVGDNYADDSSEPQSPPSDDD
jgi:hypothetical protein